MIKLGLIGTGIQGSRYLKTASTMENIKILNPCNTHGSHDGYKCFKDYKDLFNLKIDGIILAATPKINFDVIKYANFHAVPILVEKPVSLYLSDVHKMDKLKIPILVNYIHLFNPLYKKLKESIISPITRIISLGYNNGPFRSFSPLYDYMPHDLSMILDLAPGDYSIHTQKATKCKNNGVMYNIELTKRDTEINIMVGNGGTTKQRKLMVFCKNGDQFIYDDERSIDNTIPLKNVLNHFVDVIAGADPKPSFKLSMQIHEILYKLGTNWSKDEK